MVQDISPDQGVFSHNREQEQVRVLSQALLHRCDAVPLLSQVQHQALRDCLIKHTIPIRGEFVSRPLNIAQATDRRDAFVKVQSHRAGQNRADGWAGPSLGVTSLGRPMSPICMQPFWVAASSFVSETKSSPCVSPGHLWAPLPVDCQEDKCCDLHTTSPGSPKCEEGHWSPGHLWL